MSAVKRRSRYDSVAMTLHWLIAVAVVVNLCLGLYVGEILADSDPGRLPILQLHKSIGLSVLVLSLLRLGWRLANPVPPLPETISPRLRLLARASHYLLYFLIIAIPLSGWALVSTLRNGAPTFYFGLFHWPNPAFLTGLPRDVRAPLHDGFDTTHVILAFAMIALVPLHIAGAFYHARGGESVLRRMLPGVRVAPKTRKITVPS
ncbi:MAG TPA: cytochrome b [Rhizomicrobium sp.]|nr:cytochrome b [Rhizomicrobium sp.]